MRARRAHRSPLFHDVIRLHELFTGDRAARVGGYLREPGLRRAYVGYFAPLNAVKIAALLGQLQGEGSLPVVSAPRVLDLGAGPLSGVAGAWLRFGMLDRAHAVDLAARAMEDGRDLLHESGAQTEGISLQVGALASPWNVPFQGADLAILANVLNEIGDPRRDLEKRLEVVRRALKHLAPGGRLLIVEPGTRVHGRALSQLRDEILQTGLGHVLAPCRGPMPCPLLLRKGDWCHHDLPYEPPEGVQKLEQQARLQKSYLNLSYLLLSRADEPPLASADRGARELRLIGGLMNGRGGQRRYVCGENGMQMIQSKGRQFPAAVSKMARGTLFSPSNADVIIQPIDKTPRASSQPQKPWRKKNDTRRR